MPYSVREREVRSVWCQQVITLAKFTNRWRVCVQPYQINIRQPSIASQTSPSNCVILLKCANYLTNAGYAST